MCLSCGSRSRELGTENLLGKNSVYKEIGLPLCENIPEKGTHPGLGDEVNMCSLWCVISLFPYCVSQHSDCKIVGVLSGALHKGRRLLALLCVK